MSRLGSGCLKLPYATLPEQVRVRVFKVAVRHAA